MSEPIKKSLKDRLSFQASCAAGIGIIYSIRPIYGFEMVDVGMCLVLGCLWLGAEGIKIVREYYLNGKGSTGKTDTIARSSGPPY